MVSLVGVILAIYLGGFIARRVSHPLKLIVQDLSDISDYKISQKAAPTSFIKEIVDLGDSVDRMKASLRSFGKYVPKDLIRQLLASGSEAKLGGEMRCLSIFFSDIVNFTTIAEDIAPNEMVVVMGDYLDTVTQIISNHGGTIDKFMGDAVLAFFNAPLSIPRYPYHLCKAALEIHNIEVFRGTKQSFIFKTRIGLAYGDVLVGNIGTTERFSYTVLGDVVNLASRLEELNKVYGTSILATEALMLETEGAFEWRRLDCVAVKGRHHGAQIYELLDEKGAVSAEKNCRGT